MNFTQKCAILSLVFTCLIPYQGFGAIVEPSGVLTNQSLYGFKLSIVNMPIETASLFRGPEFVAPLVPSANINLNPSVTNVPNRDPMLFGLIASRPEYANLLQTRQAYEWQLSYGFDDLSVFIGGNLGFSTDEELGVSMGSAQGLYDPLAWLEPSAYWRIGSAFQPMDWLTLSLSFQQDLTYANQNVIYLGSQVKLNPAFSLELIGLMGNDASKGALLKTSYHF
jgi:hypothetical protein